MNREELARKFGGLVARWQATPPMTQGLGVGLLVGFCVGVLACLILG